MNRIQKWLLMVLLAMVGLLCWTGPACGSDSGKLTGTVYLELAGGLPSPKFEERQAGPARLKCGYFDESAKDKVVLRLTCQDGKWDDLVSAFGRAYSPSVYFGKLTKSEAVGGEQRLTVSVEYTSNTMMRNKGAGTYTIAVRSDGGKMTGTYQGSFNSNPVKGTVTGVVEALWPAVAQGIEPAKAGEHPRLWFRKADLPKLQERIKTPDGKKMITLLDALLELDRENKFHWSGRGTYMVKHASCYQEGQWATGRAFKWALDPTPENWANAMRVQKVALVARGGEWSGWCDALRSAGISLAYDMMYEGLSPAERTSMAKVLRERVTEKRGQAYSVYHAWDVMFNAVGALAALAVAGDPEDTDGFCAGMVKKFDHYFAWYCRETLGEKGFVPETMNNGDAMWNVMSYAHAMRVSQGKDVFSGTGIGWWPRLGMYSRCIYSGTDYGMAKWLGGMPPDLMPAEYRSALRGMCFIPDRYDWDELIRPSARPTPTMPQDFVQLLINYPWDTPGKPPQECNLPRVLVDEKNGGCILRSGWDEDRDFVVAIRVQSNLVGTASYAGSFEVLPPTTRAGTGRLWDMVVPSRAIMGCEDDPGGVFFDNSPYTINRTSIQIVENAAPVRGGRRTYFKSEPDGSAALTMVQDRWVAAKWGTDNHGRNNMRLEPTSADDLKIAVQRSIGVDYSGKSGVRCLIAVADRVTGAGERKAKARFTILGEQAKIDDGRFAYRYSRGNRLGAKASSKGIEYLISGAVAPAMGGSWEVGVETYDMGSPENTRKFGTMGPYLFVNGNERFTLFAIADGESPAAKDGKGPAITVTGNGLDATFKVGERHVRFDGEKVVLE